MNIFLEAAKQKLRFSSPRGELTVEQLFDLPIDSKSSTMLTLKVVATPIAAKVKNKPLKLLSFFDSKESGVDPVAKLQLDIIEEIVKIKQDEASAKSQDAVKRSRIETLKRLKQEKIVEADKELSIDDIDAELAKLEN